MGTADVMLAYSSIKLGETGYKNNHLILFCYFAASAAIVKSRDLHWALLAEREHSYANLLSLRALLVTDGHNPCKFPLPSSFTLPPFSCN